MLQTKEITGTDKVNGITYIDRETGEEHHIELEGVFVQIGLVPNTEWLGDTVERNKLVKLLLINTVLQTFLVYLLQEIVRIVLINKLLFLWDQVQQQL